MLDSGHARYLWKPVSEVERFAALGVTRLVVNLPAARGGYLDQLRTFAAGTMS